MTRIIDDDHLRSTASFLRVGCDRVEREGLDLHTKMETLEIMAKTAQALADAIHDHLALQIEVTQHDNETNNG